MHDTLLQSSGPAHGGPVQYSFHCVNPTRVLNALTALKHLRNDAELSRCLGVTPATISKIRAGKSPVSAGLLLRIHETFGLPVAELRALLATP